MQNKIDELEKLANAVEKEKNIDTAVEIFVRGGTVVKEVLAELDEIRGKVCTIIKDVDGYKEVEEDDDA